MKNRCNNPQSTQWKHYGGRGIKVCDRWNESFLNFLADMGEPPTEKHTIERGNNDGHYEPGNCSWILQKDQIKNRRPTSQTVWLEYNGKRMSVTDWAKHLGVSRHMIYMRLRAGWTVIDALTTSKTKNGRERASRPAASPDVSPGTR